MRTREKITLVFRYLCIILFGILIAVPFYWMIITSLKDPNRVFVRPMEWFTDKFRIENYSALFTQYHFEQYVFSTVKLWRMDSHSEDTGIRTRYSLSCC